MVSMDEDAGVKEGPAHLFPGGFAQSPEGEEVEDPAERWRLDLVCASAYEAQRMSYVGRRWPVGCQNLFWI